MHEHDALLLAIAAAEQRGEALVLATVVKVEGSAYRRPGARMIIPRYGASTGTISGGCLESEVSKKAWWLCEAAPVRVRYDTAGPDRDNADSTNADNNNADNNNADRDDDEAALTFGLGCNGAVSVLFERIDAVAAHPQVQILRRVQIARQAAAVALITAVHAGDAIHAGDARHASGASALPANASPFRIGQRLYTFADGDAITVDPVLAGASDADLACGNVVGPSCTGNNMSAFVRAMQIVLDEVLAARRSRQHRCVIAGVELEMFVEYLPPPPQLLIFGAGHDAQPLCTLAKQLGWRVQLVDARAHFARRERFADADGVHVVTLDAVLPDALFDAHSCAVIMSHSLSQDRHWLRTLAPKPLHYLGQLGPRQRTEGLLDDIAGSGGDGPQRAAQLRARLHYPLGLDLGGSTPDQIALAILAEIIAVLNGRSGGMLRHRVAPIHGDG